MMRWDIMIQVAAVCGRNCRSARAMDPSRFASADGRCYYNSPDASPTLPPAPRFSRTHSRGCLEVEGSIDGGRRDVIFPVAIRRHLALLRRVAPNGNADRPPRYESGLFESFEKALDPNEIFSPSRGPVLCDTPANF